MWVRTEWRDHEFFFWITPVMPGDGSGASAVQDAEPMAKIVRHRQSRVTAWVVGTEGIAELHSKFMRLDRLERLSARELEVLSLLAKGSSIQRVA